MKILVVDDEPIALRKLIRLINEAEPSAECESFNFAEDALEFIKTTKIDIAFLDIQMQDMNGLKLAEELQKDNPKINIIFCTGYSEYALDALKMYCSGYLLKPANIEGVKKVFENLRYPLTEKKKVRFSCFGNFEVFVDDKPVNFEYQKTKEMLAYLVDRKGVDVSTRELMSILFEDDFNMPYFQRLRRDLINSFSDLNQEDVIRQTKGFLGINKELVSCDYYDFLDHKNDEYKGEYMTQYSFADLTNSELENYY